ncbi:MAG: hypothetical protein AB7I30_12265 [Isosphaeraceae bacterium]
MFRKYGRIGVLSLLALSVASVVAPHEARAGDPFESAGIIMNGVGNIIRAATPQPVHNHYHVGGYPYQAPGWGGMPPAYPPAPPIGYNPYYGQPYSYQQQYQAIGGVPGYTTRWAAPGGGTVQFWRPGP